MICDCAEQPSDSNLDGPTYPLGLWLKVLLPSQVDPVAPILQTRPFRSDKETGHEEK